MNCNKGQIIKELLLTFIGKKTVRKPFLGSLPHVWLRNEKKQQSHWSRILFTSVNYTICLRPEIWFNWDICACYHRLYDSMWFWNIKADMGLVGSGVSWYEKNCQTFKLNFQTSTIFDLLDFQNQKWTWQQPKLLFSFSLASPRSYLDLRHLFWQGKTYFGRHLMKIILVSTITNSRACILITYSSVSILIIYSRESIQSGK